MNKEEVESEILKAADDCILYMPNMYTWAFLAFPNWFYQMYAEDYMSRMQSLTLCGFMNNLGTKFNAEWYLSVL